MRIKLRGAFGNKLKPGKKMVKSQKQIIILIHGIRTQGEWHELVSPILEKIPERQVISIKYGFFNVFSFLFPLWTRKYPIKKILWRLNSAIDQNPDAELTVIAHSFGTFALSQILRENPSIRPAHVILCGGIISRGFRWDQLANRPEVVINECGARDIWPILAASVTWGFGASGTFGFGAPGVIDRYHDFAHGDYFTKNFVNQFWLPYVSRKSITHSQFQDSRTTAPWWRSVMSILPLRWVLLSVVICILFLLIHPLVSKEADCEDARSWVKVAKENQRAGVISRGRPVPSAIAVSRGIFERWWKETPFSEKESCSIEVIYSALSLNSKIYRIQEIEDSRKASSFEWSNEAIRYFEEIRDSHFLTESLLDKGALFIELADIEHSDASSFRRISEDGDDVLRRAAGLAKGHQKSVALRIWSRFYYNLARPREGKLDKSWDNNYLLTSYSKMAEAIDFDPTNIKNISTYARATQKVGRNPPQDKDPEWTKRLRDAQIRLLNYWDTENSNLVEWRKRISPLSVLGVLTLEVSVREWLALPEIKKSTNVQRYLSEIENIALPAGREAFTLIRGTELEEDYDYDYLYDIARMHAARVAMLDYIQSPKAEDEFKLVISNLLLAKSNATNQQWEAGLRSLDSAPGFAALTRVRIDAIIRAMTN